MNRRLPFPPREGWPEGTEHAARLEVAPLTANRSENVWQALGAKSGLTRGGRFAFSLMLVVGLVVLGFGLVGSERDGGNPLEGGIAVIGAVVVTVVLVGIVFGMDIAFRSARGGLRHLRRPGPPGSGSPTA